MAHFVLASRYWNGVDGLPKDESKALALYARAAELGSTKAMAQLGGFYARGNIKEGDAYQPLNLRSIDKQ